MAIEKGDAPGYSKCAPGFYKKSRKFDAAAKSDYMKLTERVGISILQSMSGTQPDRQVWHVDGLLQCLLYDLTGRADLETGDNNTPQRALAGVSYRFQSKLPPPDASSTDRVSGQSQSLPIDRINYGGPA